MSNSAYPACKICDSQNLKSLFVSADSKLPICRCQNCGLVFVNYRFDLADQQEFYNDVEAYERFASSERSVPQVAARHKAWVNELKQQLDGNGPGFSEHPPELLDVGCGVGDFLVTARAEGFQVRGQELSPAAAEIAERWNNLQVQVIPLSAIPTSSVACMTMIGLLEHVIDPKEMIEQAHRIVQDGGLLFIYTPVWGAYDEIATFFARVSGNRLTRPIDRRINQAHLQIFPQWTLVHLLDTMGFKTLSCHVVSEYNLPVQRYVNFMGITQPSLQRAATKSIEFMIEHKLFFRNNMRLLAQKTR